MARKRRKSANAAAPKTDLETLPDALPPDQYLNRDLSWLEFNRRVLHEAEDERTPLLERVNFLAIFTSNPDEFIMKRVDILKRHVTAGIAVRPSLILVRATAFGARHRANSIIAATAEINPGCKHRDLPSG